MLNLAIIAFLFTESLLLLLEIREFVLGHRRAMLGYHVLSVQSRSQGMMPIHVREAVLRGILKYLPLLCLNDLSTCQ